MEEKEYRVYIYCDPRFTNKGKGHKYTFGNKGVLRLKYKPFYIGAAKGKGFLRHLVYSKSNRFVEKRIKRIRKEGIEPIIKILKSFNSRKKARILEEKLIIGIGRKDLRTGPLLNSSDGSGWKNPSLKGRERIQKAVSGENSYNYKKHLSKETCDKISKALLGEKNSMYGIRKFGEENPNSSFLNSEIEEIKFLYYIWKLTQLEIANKFGVSGACICRILNGKRYNPQNLSSLDLKEDFIKNYNSKSFVCK